MSIYKESKYKTIYEATNEELQDLRSKSLGDYWKPIYHIHPQYGLINDPNGLSYYKGKYHVFYQWYPFGTIHGMKHWGHVESKDLVNWNRLGVAITPTEEYESHGSYSGNAIEVNGELYLYYTGNIKYNKEDRDANQCLAIMNEYGEIRKYESNPIIRGVPKGYTGHVRDPKVFKYKDGFYYMLLGAQRKDETGTIIVYKSLDALKWRFIGEIELLGFDNEIGYMWECPDYINIDKKDVLIFSPQGINEQGNRYKNLFNVVYAIGKLDLSNLRFEVEKIEEFDRGFDFYAPQSFRNKNGETLIFAWAGLGEFKYPTDKKMWAHLLTFPRKLNIVDDVLVQNPVIEIEKLIKESTLEKGKCKNKIISNENNNYHIKVDIIANHCNNFGIKLLVSKEEYLNLEFDKINKLVTLDRSFLKHTFVEEYGLKRSAELSFDKKVEVEILVDNSIVEVFINGGKIAMTTRAFPLEGSTGIEIYGENEIEYSYIKSTLNRGIEE